MSYSNTFQDYLRDIPMEIGRKFFPPPIVNLPTLVLPEQIEDVAYHFDAERKARQQYDEFNTRLEPSTEQTNVANGVTADSCATSATSSVNDVLLPCAAPLTRAAPSRPLAPAVKSVSFEEFEGRGTVFDELEWRAIDDKLALSQILGNMRVESASESRILEKSVINDENSVQKPLESLADDSKPLTASAIPPYPVLEFGGSSKSDEQMVVLNSAGKLGTASFSKAPNPGIFQISIPVTVPVNEVVPSVSLFETPLRTRLLTKGYRENLVNVALGKLPRDRLPHIEYYMKGMSILEKRDVDAGKTVVFLLDSNLADKQAVVQRAQTAEQLLGMGFSAEQVFPALLACQGDRVKALDTLLGSH
uniref:UBA domain-containing protein n=1 Tax=Angiostrongylus cantonensis TaxID=6313 RepID=A0A158P9U4_ANGCA